MSTAIETLYKSKFATWPDLIRAHATNHAAKIAIVDGDETLRYQALDRLMDRIAAALQRDGVQQGQAVAIAAGASARYIAVILGALRAGCVAAPLTSTATGRAIADMVADCSPPILFLDHDTTVLLAGQAVEARTVRLDDEEFVAWLAPEDATPESVTIGPDDGFNIIYSSGTTGAPKGIVQSHAMRWAQLVQTENAGFAEAVTMIATPLYSNTTLVSVLPTLGRGGTVILMRKFDALGYLELSERHRATHTMLVPVQYQRIMALPEFDRFDLSSFQLKTCTSAPFPAALKADVLARWPGLLVEYYGMTEGGGTCLLTANDFPNKLHTVGRPVTGHDIRLIDAADREVAVGGVGEVVGRSSAMMNGYHGRSEASEASFWYDGEGRRYIRHGDVARFDADGFLILLDRTKDLIISGGFNIYPIDLENALRAHPAVADCAVVGVPSSIWGETPVGFYVARDATANAEAIIAWVNARLGKSQRLSALHLIDELPRNAIGKVLKRELRDQLGPVDIVDSQTA